jgi:pimeloyl-ACP methyl ester carboxylesterase
MHLSPRVLLTGFATMLVATGQVQTSPFSFSQEPFTHAQRLVDIGHGRRLNLYCIGKGSPIVVLDLGFGAPLISWGPVQSAVAATTRVCSYERAGYGFSDPAPAPRTTSAIVDDLHALLAKAGETPPYVLVGHSMAGLDVLLYADRYPTEVAGSLMIDPVVPGWDAIAEQLFPGFRVDGDRFVATLAACESLAAEGQLQVRSPANKQCLPPPDPRFTKAVQTARDATKQRPGYWLDLRSEAVSEDDADMLELQSARRTFGDMPLLILSAPLDASTYRQYGATREQITKLTRARTTVRDQIAALSQRGIQCAISDTGHFIQLDRPAVVIDAIRRLIQLSLNHRSPSCAGLNQL